MKAIAIILLYLSFMSCHKQFDEPWRQASHAGILDFPTFSFNAANGSTNDFSVGQAYFLINNVLDSATRTYSLTADNGLATLTIMIHTDSLRSNAVYTNSIVRATVHLSCNAPSSERPVAGNISMVILSNNLLGVNGSISGSVFNEATGGRIYITGTLSNVPIYIQP